MKEELNAWLLQSLPAERMKEWRCCLRSALGIYTENGYNSVGIWTEQGWDRVGICKEEGWARVNSCVQHGGHAVC